MKIKTLLIFPIILVIVFGGIVIADGIGIWQTESTKIPMTISSGEFEGEYDPADIRGSYSFLDIENAFGVASETIAKAFGITSDDPASIKAKDLEEIYGETDQGLEIGTGSIRSFIAYYIGMEYEGDDGFPKQAVDVLKEEGKWSAELDELYEGRIIDLSVFGAVTAVSSEDVTTELVNEEIKNPEEHDEDEELVKGKTTVADIISWGISLEEIEEILTVKVENKNMLIRDICTQNEIAFSEVKNALNALLEP